MAQSNAICAKTAKRIQDGASSVFPNPTQAASQDSAQVQTFAQTVVLPALQAEYAQLAALRTTSDTNPTDTVNALESAIDKWEIDKTAMASLGDASFKQFDSLATDFGMTTCAATDGIVRSITVGTQGAS